MIVNGKIRLLCKVENPSVPIFLSTSLNNPIYKIDVFVVIKLAKMKTRDGPK